MESANMTLYKYEEVAEKLSTTKQNIKYLVDTKKIKTTVIGGGTKRKVRRISEENLQNYLKSLED